MLFTISGAGFGAGLRLVRWRRLNLTRLVSAPVETDAFGSGHRPGRLAARRRESRSGALSEAG